MDTLELILPWPPSLNHYKKVGAIVKTKNGKLYQQRTNTNETKMFYWQVYQSVKKIKPQEGFKFRFSKEIFCKVGMNVDLYPPHAKRFDLDNRLKVLSDSLTRAQVWVDDSQVYRLFVQKLDIIPGGQVKVLIYELEG